MAVRSSAWLCSRMMDRMWAFRNLIVAKNILSAKKEEPTLIYICLSPCDLSKKSFRIMVAPKVMIIAMNLPLAYEAKFRSYKKPVVTAPKATNATALSGGIPIIRVRHQIEESALDISPE